MSNNNLLSDRRFLPFFMTQFFGALNDNVYKQALLYLVTFSLISWHGGMDATVFNNISAALFILPYFLLSFLAGQIADKYESATLIRRIKNAEILIMLLVAASFFFQWFWGLLIALLLTGVQSTFFSPIKYAYLPKHIPERQLMLANGWLQLGTFSAIIFGAILAGLAIHAFSLSVAEAVSLFVLLLACLGRLSAQYIPKTTVADPNLILRLNPITESIQLFRYCRHTPGAKTLILGISWFWFLGICLLSQLPKLVADDLGGDTTVLNIVLALFAIGIGIGAVLCKSLSKNEFTLKWSRLASALIAVFLIEFYFCCISNLGQLTSAQSLFQSASSLRFMADVLILGALAGIFVVPLLSLLQLRSPPAYLARIISASNISNALFMILASVFAIVMIELAGLSIPSLFLTLAALQIVAWALLQFASHTR